jgi:hypothetical protein
MKIFYLAIFLGIFIFSGSAYALKFTGDAWFAQHYTYGQATGEYYLVIDNTDIGNLKKVKLKGFKLRAPTSVPDFYYLTGNTGTEGVAYFEIKNKGKLKKWEKKARKKSKKLIKKGKLDVADREAWINEWMTNKLDNKLFKLVFKDEDGSKYKAMISFATFDNPVNHGSFTEGSNNTAPVPEPTTMLLLGTGLLGIAAFRKRFK